MKFFLNVVICSLCLNLTLSKKNTYRVAIVNNNVDLNRYSRYVNDAAKHNVDMLVLPSVTEYSVNAPDNYDQVTKSISNAAKQGGVYVVANLMEKTRCQNKEELIRSNLVFDRLGDIISIYRKPVNKLANCTTDTNLSSFTTDFGATFGLLMEEDLVLQDLEGFKLKNFVMTGSWSSEIPFLSASQFSSSWAYVNNFNLVSSAGIFAGRSGAIGSGTGFVVADLQKDGGFGEERPPVINPTQQPTFHGEDLSQYIIRPLDVAASSKGYSETVCHGKFCCEFYVKGSFVGSKQNEISYGLAVFDGVRHFGQGHNIGTQSCAVYACAGLYKRTCSIGSQNNSTNTHFEKISIKGNFSTSSVQYPIVMSTETVKNFNFDSSAKSQASIEIIDSNNLFNFGIFGRDFSKDFESIYVSKDNKTDGVNLDVLEYLYNEEMQEFVDYVWIRLRILIVVASIYVLEMLFAPVVKVVQFDGQSIWFKAVHDSEYPRLPRLPLPLTAVAGAEAPLAGLRASTHFAAVLLRFLPAK